MRRARALCAAGVFLAAAAHGQDVRSILEGADPDFEVANGQYWLYPTGGKALYTWHSVDLLHWERGARLISLEEIGWLNDDRAPKHALWAPDMIAVGRRYYFYYSVGPQNPTPSRIGVAVCDGPAGPCRDSGRPLVNDGGNGFEAIDPAVFIDPKTKTPYLYAGGSAGAKLRVWVLKRDMITIDHEVRVETPKDFTEGSFMFERNGTYYLSYSSGYWRDATYSVRYSTAPSPIGPWKYRGAILESDTKYKGPGHHAFVRDPKNGQWYIAYHRWEGQNGDGPYFSDQRRVAVQPVAFSSGGAIIPVKMD